MYLERDKWTLAGLGTEVSHVTHLFGTSRISGGFLDNLVYGSSSQGAGFGES